MPHDVEKSFAVDAVIWSRTNDINRFASVPASILPRADLWVLSLPQLLSHPHFFCAFFVYPFFLTTVNKYIDGDS